MATTIQRDRVRGDLDATSTDLPDLEVDDLYLRAEERYATNSAAVEAYVRILAIRRLQAGAAKRVDYTQNESQEKLSQVFAHLQRLRELYESDLDDAGAAAGNRVQWGGLRVKPPRIEEYPDGC